MLTNPHPHFSSSEHVCWYSNASLLPARLTNLLVDGLQKLEAVVSLDRKALAAYNSNIHRKKSS